MAKTPAKTRKPKARPTLPSGGGSWTRTRDGGLEPVVAPTGPAPTPAPAPAPAPAEPAGDKED